MSLWFNLELWSMVFTMIVFVWVVFRAKKRKYAFGGLDGISFHVRSGKKNESKFESRCRLVFEKLFNKRFVSCRPNWLRNPLTGRNLELDGFCPSIITPLGKGLAFEADGQQHAQFTNRFHTSENQFVYQYKKDSFKTRKCIERGVLLIRIPHFVTGSDIEGWIVTKLRQNGVVIPNEPSPPNPSASIRPQKKRTRKAPTLEEMAILDESSPPDEIAPDDLDVPEPVEPEDE